MSETEDAVNVRCAYKYFVTEQNVEIILDDFKMSVQKGSM